MRHAVATLAIGWYLLVPASAGPLRGELSGLAITFNNEFDRLTEAITRFEQYVLDLNLHAFASTVISHGADDINDIEDDDIEDDNFVRTDEEDTYGVDTRLVFIRRGSDSSGLYVEKGAHRRMRRLREASHSERTEAVRVFPHLLASLRDHAAADLTVVQEARKQAEAFLAELNITK